jgi:hypothetical protein
MKNEHTISQKFVEASYHIIFITELCYLHTVAFTKAECKIIYKRHIQGETHTYLCVVELSPTRRGSLGSNSKESMHLLSGTWVPDGSTQFERPRSNRERERRYLTFFLQRTCFFPLSRDLSIAHRWDDQQRMAEMLPSDAGFSALCWLFWRHIQKSK